MQIWVPVVAALVTLVASHQFAAWRDRENKRREERVNYLDKQVFRLYDGGVWKSI